MLCYAILDEPSLSFDINIIARLWYSLIARNSNLGNQYWKLYLNCFYTMIIFMRWSFLWIRHPLKIYLIYTIISLYHNRFADIVAIKTEIISWDTTLWKNVSTFDLIINHTKVTATKCKKNLFSKALFKISNRKRVHNQQWTQSSLSVIF